MSRHDQLIQREELLYFKEKTTIKTFLAYNIHAVADLQTRQLMPRQSSKQFLSSTVRP